MKRIDFTKLGGLHTYQDTLEFMQDSYRNSLGAIAAFLGNKYVVSGCVDNGVNVTNGWIVVDGELIPFTGGAIGATVVVQEAIAQEGFDDATLKDVYYTKTASFGVGGFPYADLKRLPFELNTVQDFAEQVKNILQAIIQHEPEVILSGCEVTDVTTGPDEMEVAAGLVLFEGAVVVTEAYSGAYPAWLKEDGTWATAEPGSGLFIAFDPYTSQRYVNVLDRAMTPTGRIVMHETLTNRFDASGVGRWEMKGYSLSSALQNRVPIGYWFDDIPVTGVSDVINQTVGANQGERATTLTRSQLPAESLRLRDAAGNLLVDDTAGGGSFWSLDIKDNDNSLVGGYLRTENLGDGNAHNNVQPSVVIVYAKRTA